MPCAGSYGAKNGMHEKSVCVAVRDHPGRQASAKNILTACVLYSLLEPLLKTVLLSTHNLLSIIRMKKFIYNIFFTVLLFKNVIFCSIVIKLS